MSKRAMLALSIAMCAAPALAADDAATRKDLTSVIALQGLPCGEVVSVKTQGENDYIATCKDKNRRPHRGAQTPRYGTGNHSKGW